jgi:hypothetical protein
MNAKARFLVLELARWLAVYALYLLGRELAIANEQEAIRHTEGLARVERALGVYQEEHVQDAASWTHVAGRLFQTYYMFGFAPVCVAVLLWSAYRHRDVYLLVRRRLVAALVLATPFFVLFPAAPPRIVEGLGIADTVGLSNHDTGSFLGIRFNPYAAMPSLHVGWSLLIALAVLSLFRRRVLRIAAAAHPVLMALAVTATGNHLFLDIAVGVAIALAAIALARVQLTQRRNAMSRQPLRRAFALAATSTLPLVVLAGCGGTAPQPLADGTPTTKPQTAVEPTTVQEVDADVLFVDDFSAGCGAWSNDRDTRVALGCADGAYRVLVKNPDRPQQSRLFNLEPTERLSVESDAILIKPRRGQFEFQGVSCWKSNGLVGYVFLISPDGSYYIVKEDVTAGGRRMLKTGESGDILPGPGARNRIGGDCAGDGRGPTELTLYVNRRRVAGVRERRGAGPFGGFGLFVGTSEPNTDVRFDDVIVRRA